MSAAFGQRRSHTALLGALACAVLVASCAFPRDTRIAPAQYDIGQLQADTRERPRINATLLVPAVGAPAWLDTMGIAYRLAYEDATRVRTYANSRWVDTPATLVTEHLRSRLAATASRVINPGDGARADYALRVELEDFSQTFDAPDSSRVLTRVRVSLVNLVTRNVDAQRTFQIERPAAPTAAGAADALADASQALLDNVLAWTAQSLKNRDARQISNEREYR
ncbi:MAG TPA: ABC-type transport auxiliary lipoprotein family protein [Burkholderiales bacterium]|nr:ABC-type transport auxiliary lipoprotein family protein [Burkholderiales bacterium]